MAKVKEKDGLTTVLEGDEKVSRRKIIKAGAAAALGAAVTAALPGVASAADGDALKAGEVKTATQETGVKLADDSLVGLFLANDVHPDPGVTQPVGIFGLTKMAGEMSAGVMGQAQNEDATGVFGVNFWGGNGVRGYSRSAGGAGVQGISEGSGPGVSGIGPIGVKATSDSANGRALDVKGKAHFTNSGHTHIGRGHKYKTFRSRRLFISKNALILVTLQSSAGPSVVVQYAKRVSRYAFKVYLNKKAKQKAKLAFFIIN